MMEFKFVAIASKEYNQGLLIREQLFFKEFLNAQTLLNDTHEQESLHLVALTNQRVIGTGRLTIVENIGVISQMTVLPDFQKKNVGKQILELLIDKVANFNCSSVELSACITALGFYEKCDFLPIGRVYSSKKTGVLHQKMVLQLLL